MCQSGLTMGERSRESKRVEKSSVTEGREDSPVRTKTESYKLKGDGLHIKERCKRTL